MQDRQKIRRSGCAFWIPVGTLLLNMSIGYEEELLSVDVVKWMRRGLVDVTNLRVVSASPL